MSTSGSKTKMKRIIFFIIALLVSQLFLILKLKDTDTSFISPFSRDILHEKRDIFNETIKPRLERTANSYKLNRERSLIPQAHAYSPIPNVNSYIVVDYDTGTVLNEKNAAASTRIASITKIMTAVVALDLADSSEYFTVSEYAAGQVPTKIGVVAGQEMTLKELLEAALLTSANDAVQVIQEGIDAKYGDAVFVRAMNAKARALGLSDTTFDNPQGFDGNNHFSTAGDVAILTHYALENYQLIAQIVEKDKDFLPEDMHHKQFDLPNWNGLIGVYPDIKGVKIGSTGEAGKTTVVLSERGGKKILVVLLGAGDIFDRDLLSARLLDNAYEQELGLEPVNLTIADMQEKYASWNYY